MGRKHAPDSRDPDDFREAGYAESSATSMAYRGGMPRVTDDELVDAFRNRMIRIAEEGSDRDATSAAAVVFRNFKKSGKEEDVEIPEEGT